MDEEQIISFKEQMRSCIYHNAFESIEQWQAHLIYMIYNPSEYWMNIISIFNFRKAPVRVLRIAEWKKRLEPVSPLIKKGSTGIPVLAKETRTNKIGVNIRQEKICHDAWDINDFVDGDQLYITAPFFDEIKKAQKNDINFHPEDWQDFIDRTLDSKFPDADKERRTFLQESFFYLIYGDQDINFDFINLNKGNPRVLCRIYKDMSVLLKKALSDFQAYVINEQARLANEKIKNDLWERMNRKLPQRLEDAEKILAQQTSVNNRGQI